LDEISHNYGTPIVGETADWYLNDVHNSALKEEDIMQAFSNALTQDEVLEGQHGGGAGMTCHMYPGGTGTSSRIVKWNEEGMEVYTVGVLCQTNYGHTYDLKIAGVPIGDILLKEKGPEKKVVDSTLEGKADDGSIVTVLMLVPQPISFVRIALCPVKQQLLKIVAPMLLCFLINLTVSLVIVLWSLLRSVVMA